MPEGQRWQQDKIQGMKGTPEQPDPQKPGSKLPLRVHFEETRADENEEPADGEETEIRRRRITTATLQKYGYQDNCRARQMKKAGLKP